MRFILTLLAAIIPIATPAMAEAPPPPARNLLLITLDTVRRDHLSVYGYPRETTPALDALAERAVVLDRAFAQETNTNPSHATMFTGQYPHVHGSRRNGDRLRDGNVTLAETLRAAGWRTAAFVSGVSLNARISGLDRGFEHYDDGFASERREGATTSALARRWLTELRPGERWFLFVHLFDAHGPYEPTDDYRTLFRSEDPGPAIDVPDYQLVRNDAGVPQRGLRGYVDRYDAMLRYVDDRVGELVALADRESTVVVIVGDHGESLGERHHKLDHGGQVFEEEIRIPLIVSAPGIAPGRADALVETTDLLPTALELLGVAAPTARPLAGASLVPLLRSPAAAAVPARTHVFSSARAAAERHADRGYDLDGERSIHAIRTERWKLIRYPGRQRDYVELYDLRTDPGERENVVAHAPGVRDDLAARLDAWLGDAGPASPPEIDPEDLRKLRDLGYVGD